MDDKKKTTIPKVQTPKAPKVAPEVQAPKAEPRLVSEEKCPECASKVRTVRNFRHTAGSGGGVPCRNSWHEE